MKSYIVETGYSAESVGVPGGFEHMAGRVMSELLKIEESQTDPIDYQNASGTLPLLDLNGFLTLAKEKFDIGVELVLLNQAMGKKYRIQDLIVNLMGIVDTVNTFPATQEIKESCFYPDACEIGRSLIDSLEGDSVGSTCMATFLLKLLPTKVKGLWNRLNHAIPVDHRFIDVAKSVSQRHIKGVKHVYNMNVLNGTILQILKTGQATGNLFIVQRVSDVVGLKVINEQNISLPEYSRMVEQTIKHFVQRPFSDAQVLVGLMEPFLRSEIVSECRQKEIQSKIISLFNSLKSPTNNTSNVFVSEFQDIVRELNLSGLNLGAIAYILGGIDKKMLEPKLLSGGQAYGDAYLQSVVSVNLNGDNVPEEYWQYYNEDRLPEDFASIVTNHEITSETPFIYGALMEINKEILCSKSKEIIYSTKIDMVDEKYKIRIIKEGRIVELINPFLFIKDLSLITLGREAGDEIPDLILSKKAIPSQILAEFNSTYQKILCMNKACLRNGERLLVYMSPMNLPAFQPVCLQSQVEKIEPVNDRVRFDEYGENNSTRSGLPVESIGRRRFGPREMSGEGMGFFNDFAITSQMIEHVVQASLLASVMSNAVSADEIESDAVQMLRNIVPEVISDNPLTEGCRHNELLVAINKGDAVLRRLCFSKFEIPLGNRVSGFGPIDSFVTQSGIDLLEFISVGEREAKTSGAKLYHQLERTMASNISEIWMKMVLWRSRQLGRAS